VFKGFEGQLLNISAENEIIFESCPNANESLRPCPTLRLTNDQVFFENIDNFVVIDPDTEEKIFDLSEGEIFLEGQTDSLQVFMFVVENIFNV